MTRGSRYTLAAFGIFFLLAAIFMPTTRASLDTRSEKSRKQEKGDEWTYGTAQTIGQGTTVSVADMMEIEKKRPKPKVTGERFTKDEFEFMVHHRRTLQNGPDSPRVAAWPPSAIEKDGKAGEPIRNTPQTVGNNFLGVVSSEAGGFVPPDSHGAVGPTQVVAAANVFMRSFNKTTGVADGVLALSLSTFFAPVSGGAGLSDPRVKFDPISRRWFISIITTSSTNRVLFAISNGENITSTSSFTFFSFAATDGGGAESQTPFADYDTLGIDATGVYFGINMFNTAGTAFLGSTVFVINKANLFAATPTLTVTAFRQLNNGSGPGPYTPYVADNPDPAATEAYLVGTDNASFGLLQLRRITGAGTPTPAISGNLSVTVPATSAPLNVTVQGRSQAALDALDDRLYEAKVRNGRLWTAHNIQVNSSGVASTTGGRTGSRWYEIGNLSTTPTLIQSGTLFSSAATNADSFWIPSIGITGQGHAALACSAAGPARFPDIVYAGRLSGDATGTLRAPTTGQASANSYNVTANRWGDYSHVATDPNDDMTMWTFQEYAPSTTTWGVRAIQLRAPAPAAVTSISPTSATQGQTLNITVNGTSDGNTGFYNPPAPFPNKLAANFGSGVTVNSVTFNSPTQAVFNVTVAGGATTGTRNVTVTNPDGQSSTGNNLFTVNAGCVSPITISPTSLPTGITGITYSQTFTASGGAAPYTFSLAAGTLPTGLSIVGDTLSGIPTAAGTFNFTILATDNSGFSCTGSQSYSVTIGAPALTRGAVTVTTGNNLIEPNECNSLTVALSNGGTADATGVSATLSTTTPGVTVTTATSAYPNILAGGGAQTNATAFQVSTDNTVTCGSTINFTLSVTYVGGSASFNFTQLVGQAAGTNYNFASTTGATISSGGTLIPLSADDDAVVSFAVPFAFSVYGTSVASGQNIRLSTNGQARIETAGSTTSTLTNAALPSGATGLPTAAPVLFPYWDDLDMRTTITSGGGIYSEVTGTAPNRTLKLEWRARHFVASQTLGAPDTNFAIYFHEGSNQFEYVYALTGAGANAAGASATVGIQAASTGTTFTQFSFNTASLSAGQQLAAAIPAGICNPGTGGCVGCTYIINPTSTNVVAAGGTGSVTVTAGTGCAWTAVSNDAFITVTGGASGSGNGTVNYSVAANSGPARTGTITIAGQTFTVNQGNGCSYVIAPTSTSVAAGGGSGSVTVTTATGCTWTAASNDAFITVTGGASGSGNGTVTYSVATNTGTARTGTITIAGQTFTVNQDAAGATCGTPTVINSSLSFSATGSLQPTTCGAQGYVNNYVLNATITNIGSQTLCNLSAQVTELAKAGGVPPAQPLRLISADGATCTTGGLVGSVQTISMPSTLAPGQSANVTFIIALSEPARFRFTFNMFGGIQSGSVPSVRSPAKLQATPKSFELNVEPKPTVKAQTFTFDRVRGELRRR